MPQTATTGNLENAQKIIIATSRYTEEHNAPAINLLEQFKLPKGSKQITVPKVAQMSVSDLTDGQDIVDEEDIGMTSVDLTASEVGTKVILTDKLVRQSAENVFSMIGRQLGDGMARKKDTDVIALWPNLNGNTVFGADGAAMNTANTHGCISGAKANKFGNQLYLIHHPNAVATLSRQAATTADTAAAAGLTNGWSVDLLQNFYSGLRPINNVPIFEDGNIEKISSVDSGYGVIADKTAMAALTSVSTRTERQRDASLRATELVMTADYGVFELDDTRGAAVQFEIGDLATS
tara:strand:+ start:1171 stop:2049 length:879 start_codon:yes stop_codon:yes gene_type:complete